MTAIHVSSGAFASRRLADILADAEARGITALELSSDVAHDPDAVARTRAARERFSLMLHNYFPAPERAFVLNLAAADPAIARRSLEHCRAAMRLAAEVGSPVYSVHGGFMVQPEVGHLGRGLDLRDPAPRAEGLARFAGNVAALLETARGLGIRFLIENNVLEPANAPNGRNDALLMVEAGEMAAFAEEMDDPAFGYLIDVGHLKVSARTLGFSRETFLETLAPWIAGFHLSDNDGRRDSNQPFGGDAWFLPWLARFPSAFRVVEAYRLDDEELRGCLAAVSAASPSPPPLPAAEPAP